MIVKLFDDKRTLGHAAAEEGATAIRKAIAQRGRARVIHSTGASQFELLEALTAAPGIEWDKVEMFHLDEYVGLPATHPACFRRYLMERLIGKTGIRHHHLIDGEGDPAEVMARVGEALCAAPIDIAFVGIGENGHLAFNDPPADFETEEPFIVVGMDMACRLQQVHEGWFATLDEVPTTAITMTVRQILKARKILCIVPDGRKAAAVQLCVNGEITPMAPASILRTHPDATLYLDRDSAALLDRDVVMAGEA